MTLWLMLAAFVLPIAAFLCWRYRGEPAGWTVGPIVHGRNSSRGIKLKRVAGAIWAVLIQPGGVADLHGITMARVALNRGIRVRYRVIGTGLYPSEDASALPMLTLYVARRGNRWTLNGDDAFNRWYTTVPLPLTEGEHSFDIPFELDCWHCVTGAWAAWVPVKFAAALADEGRVGLAFGHAGGRMHGLMARAPVAFELIEWSAT